MVKKEIGSSLSCHLSTLLMKQGVLNIIDIHYFSDIIVLQVTTNDVLYINLHYLYSQVNKQITDHFESHHTFSAMQSVFRDGEWVHLSHSQGPKRYLNRHR